MTQLSFKILIYILIAIATASNATARSRATLVQKAPRYVEQDSITTACVHIDENPLIFPGSFKLVTAFEHKLENLLRTHKGNLNVWHVGGSHVQADILSHRLRCNLAQLAGVTGTRGMLFPFAMAKTNCGNDYRMSFTGTWTTSRNIAANPDLPLGITGIAAETSDRNATISFSFNNNGTLKWQFDGLRVLCESKAPVDSISLTVTDDNGKEWNLHCAPDGTYCNNQLSWHTGITLNISNPTGAQFILRGIEPLNSREGTINYYSSGINGASTLSWLRCERLEQDLMLIKPDLVVLGIGINDAAMTTSQFDPEKFQSRYRRILDMVRRTNPNALFLFITNNDTFYKGVPNGNAIAVRESFVTLAREYDGCVWDCLGVMGGLGSSTQWRSAGLMAKDRIHFNRKGYELLADLIFEALITDFIDNDE